MSKTRLFVIIQVILFLGFAGSLRAEQYFPLTASQKHFTSIVGQLPGVINTDWRTPVSLWVKVSSKAVGSPPSAEKADKLAGILADRGKTALYQPFCVHIYQSSSKELGSQCVY